MLTANEARNYKSAEPTEMEINKVELAIKRAASEGFNRALLYHPLSPQMVSKLRDLGYSVEQSEDRDGFIAIIKW